MYLRRLESFQHVGAPSAVPVHSACEEKHGFNKMTMKLYFMDLVQCSAGPRVSGAARWGCPRLLPKPVRPLPASLWQASPVMPSLASLWCQASGAEPPLSSLLCQASSVEPPLSSLFCQASSTQVGF